MSVHQKRKIKWALDSTKAQLTGKCVHYNKVSLYIEVLFHIIYYYWGKEIVPARTSLYRGSLYQAYLQLFFVSQQTQLS